MEAGGADVGLRTEIQPARQTTIEPLAKHMSGSPCSCNHCTGGSCRVGHIPELTLRRGVEPRGIPAPWPTSQHVTGPATGAKVHSLDWLLVTAPAP